MISDNDSITLSGISIPRSAFSVADQQPGRLHVDPSLLVIGSIIALPLLVIAYPHEPGLITMLLPLPLSVLTAFAAIVAHELGHLAAAWCCGWRIQGISAFGFFVSNDGHRPRLRRTRTTQVSGYVLASPREEHNVRRQRMIFTAAGPISGMLIGCYLIGIAVFANQHIWVQLIGWVAGLSVAGVSAIQLVPFRRVGLESDGTTLVMLARGGAEAERSDALLQLAVLERSGTRPCEWDEEIINRAVALADGTFDESSAAIYSFFHLYDLGATAEALEMLERALSAAATYPAPMRVHAFATLVYFSARQRQNLADCHEVLDVLRSGYLTPAMLARVTAAVLLAEGDPSAAAQIARDTLARVGRSFPNDDALDVILLQDILHEATSTSALVA
jgi:hypothetical protein